jgi:hypothetical protein
MKSGPERQPFLNAVGTPEEDQVIITATTELRSYRQRRYDVPGAAAAGDAYPE